MSDRSGRVRPRPQADPGAAAVRRTAPAAGVGGWPGDRPGSAGRQVTIRDITGARHRPCSGPTGDTGIVDLSGVPVTRTVPARPRHRLMRTPT